MFNFQSLIKHAVWRLLTLAIIFCLSGMMNIVCCFAKCQIVTKEFSVSQTNNASCHQSETTDLIAESDSCSVTGQSCEESSEELSLEITAPQNTLDNSSQENKTSSYQKAPTCKMSCCLPSDEVIDITPLPRLDSPIAVNSLHLVFSTTIGKDKTHLAWPIEKLPDQEKTYLRCCVFLI
jgi:hypothetical protein